MVTTPIENRRKAAHAIEHAIERQLDLLHVPVPEHHWVVDSGYSEVLMTYETPLHDKVDVIFTSDELDNFEHFPRFATLSKIASLASLLLKEHKKLSD